MKITYKYRLFIKSIFCALIALPFCLWGMYIIKMGNSYRELIIPFLGILFCLVLGVTVMLKNCEAV